VIYTDKTNNNDYGSIGNLSPVGLFISWFVMEKEYLSQNDFPKYIELDYKPLATKIWESGKKLSHLKDTKFYN